jgi:hypothetical protein
VSENDDDKDRGHGSEERPDPKSTPPPRAEGELIAFPERVGAAGKDGGEGRGPRIDTGHLTANRGLIIRRSLLSTAVGGLVPIPVMDDYLAGRVRAGMLMQIADRRRVDIVPSSAELLGDPPEGSALRSATMTAATVIALKLAWRKIFAVMAVGRRAEEMTTTFQMGTLFDHFCARLHVGAGIDRNTAVRLRHIMLAAIRDTERRALVESFRDGAELLGRSLSEAPAWVSHRLQKAVESYVASGGNPDARVAAEADAAIDPDQARWLDRAASRVEARLGRLGNGYLQALVARFESGWTEQQTLVP